MRLCDDRLQLPAHASPHDVRCPPPVLRVALARCVSNNLNQKVYTSDPQPREVLHFDVFKLIEERELFSMVANENIFALVKTNEAKVRARVVRSCVRECTCSCGQWRQGRHVMFDGVQCDNVWRSTFRVHLSMR